MYFVFHQVVKLEHGHHTHSDRLVKWLPGFPVPENLLADNGNGNSIFLHVLIGGSPQIFISDAAGIHSLPGQP